MFPVRYELNIHILFRSIRSLKGIRDISFKGLVVLLSINIFQKCSRNTSMRTVCFDWRVQIILKNCRYVAYIHGCSWASRVRSVCLCECRSGRSISEFAAGPLQHSKSWFRVPSGPMAIFLLFPRLLRILKWCLLFSERRDLTTTGHYPSTGGGSSG
jgi:hypothetical protein